MHKGQITLIEHVVLFSLFVLVFFFSSSVFHVLILEVFSFFGSALMN